MGLPMTYFVHICIRNFSLQRLRWLQFVSSTYLPMTMLSPICAFNLPPQGKSVPFVCWETNQKTTEPPFVFWFVSPRDRFVSTLSPRFVSQWDCLSGYLGAGFRSQMFFLSIPLGDKLLRQIKRQMSKFGGQFVFWFVSQKTNQKTIWSFGKERLWEITA